MARWSRQISTSAERHCSDLCQRRECEWQEQGYLDTIATVATVATELPVRGFTKPRIAEYILSTIVWFLNSTRIQRAILFTVDKILLVAKQYNKPYIDTGIINAGF